MQIVEVRRNARKRVESNDKGGQLKDRWTHWEGSERETELGENQWETWEKSEGSWVGIWAVNG